MDWTVEELLGEIAEILVWIENGQFDVARIRAEKIVGDTNYHAQAFQDYVALVGELGDDNSHSILEEDYDEQVEDFLTDKWMEENPTEWIGIVMSGTDDD